MLGVSACPRSRCWDTRLVAQSPATYTSTESCIRCALRTCFTPSTERRHRPHLLLRMPPNWPKATYSTELHIQHTQASYKTYLGVKKIEKLPTTTPASSCAFRLSCNPHWQEPTRSPSQVFGARGATVSRWRCTKDQGPQATQEHEPSGKRR